MRLLIPVLLLALVSCGKSSSSGRSPNKDEGHGIREEVDHIVETDLLDVTIDVPVEVTADKIIFKRSDSQMVGGLHTNCNLSVESGEFWDYALSGNNVLELYKGRQKYSMKRVGDGSGIVGSWSWKGYEGRTLIFRRLTFVSKERLIMRADCEQ